MEKQTCEVRIEFQSFKWYEVEYDNEEQLDELIEELKVGNEEVGTFIADEDNPVGHDISPR